MKIDIGGRWMCVEEKKQEKRKEKKNVWMKKKTYERKENNIRNKRNQN